MTDGTTFRMTASEYLLLPETTQPMELLDGEVIMSPAPIPEHQTAVGNTYLLISGTVKERGGRAFFAPLDVRLDDLNVVQPDVMYLAPDTRCIVGEKYLIGAPDLIVEVLSPGSIKTDKRDKFRLYERFGVREYWLVSPRDQLVEVWLLTDQRFVLLNPYGVGETFESPLLGSVDASALFA